MIQVYVTGGTFDKQYNYITGELYFEGTHLKEMFERGRCSLDIDIKTLMMVDSLEMTEEDRGIIVHNCVRSKLDKILITHGTDRMVETAKALAAAEIPKTIVLTGAMRPFEMKQSDALQNLTEAIFAAGVLPPGVYCASHGRVLPFPGVRKDPERGTFVKS